MEEQVIQIPIWAIPFLVGLELIIFYAVAKIGRLIVTCQDALDWSQRQQSTPSFDSPSFMENVNTVINDIRPPIWNAVIAFSINIYCIVMMYSGEALNPWVVFFAVYSNTNAIVNLVTIGGLTNKIVNTVVAVEQAKLEEALENTMEEVVKEFEKHKKAFEDEEK